ncbi:MAG: TonB-dependent receptor domain-containing protein [Gammaproteobacteria bacterium]
MLKQTELARALGRAFIGGATVGLVVLSVPSSAQEAAAPLVARVEITGSSIKRIAAEGALPVQTLTRTQIEQVGVANVADLVAALPAMQGFLTASTSVNGGGNGVQTASLHAIGKDYTLVLLNGRRMAPYGSSSAVNLASIPLSAVERVEILTDGASTLYGSDAIAGVINFILKKNQQDANVELTLNSPQHAGGRSANFSLSKGFGDLDKDGYNVLLAYSHDLQRPLDAAQRDFARSGVRAFEHAGQKYVTWQTSINSTPANVEVVGGSGAGAFDEVLSVDLIRNGACSSPNTFARGGACRFDYPATVQLIPRLKRDSVFASGSLRVGADTRLFGELVLSRFTNTARYAPAAQPLTTFSTDPATGQRSVNPSYLGAYNANVVPLLAGLGIDPAQVTDAFLYYRGVDAGGRTDRFATDALHAVIGAETRLAGWDVSASYTHSRNRQKDDAVAGYISADTFESLIRSGAYNPYLPNPNGASVLAPAVLQGTLETKRSRLDVANVRASSEVFALPGGQASLGAGADYTRQRFEDLPAPIYQGPGPQNPGWTDVAIGGSTGLQALDATRSNWGVFAELLMPVLKNLEATAAVRYDSYGTVNKHNVSYDVAGHASAPGEVGNDMSKSTYKLSMRYTPVPMLLLRGSYGSGFKAPTMNDIADPLKNFGSSNFFACPIKSPSDPRYLYCKPGSSEYDLLTDGNPRRGDAGLRPETSRQATFGGRIEPVASLSLGLDWWDVKLKNQVQPLSQQQIFEDPALADRWISVYYDPIQKSNVLAATLSPVNLSSSHYRGIDWDFIYRVGKTPIGHLTASWTGTQMLKAEQDVPGSSTGVENSIGRFDSYNNVTFRTISRLVLSLRSYDWLSNSLTFSYRSGYHDQPLTEDDASVRIVNPDGSIGAVVAMQRDVASYTTVDYQGRATLGKRFVLTVGIRNLLDRDPPLSIRNAGGGNQVGYDGRYTDPLGRTFYLTGNYRF